MHRASLSLEASLLPSLTLKQEPLAIVAWEFRDGEQLVELHPDTGNGERHAKSICLNTYGPSSAHQSCWR